MKILIVDDESIILESCRRVLEPEGFEVTIALTADEGLKQLEHDDFRLLIIDVKMPGHDGIYLIRQVKEKCPDMPVIVMSGYPTPETISKAADEGSATFIAKPFTPDELLETVLKVIQDLHDPGEEAWLDSLPQSLDSKKNTGLM
jgi:DNA-binding NtrC family response regulator